MNARESECVYEMCGCVGVCVRACAVWAGQKEKTVICISRSLSRLGRIFDNSFESCKICKLVNLFREFILCCCIRDSVLLTNVLLLTKEGGSYIF